MGRGDDDAAVAEIVLHDRGEGRLRRGVERGRRLVEQPERPAGDEQAGERDAALLSGGERAGRKVDHMREADARQRAAARLARTIAAERARPEGEVLARGQRAFQRVRVAEVMGLLADGPLGVAAFEREAPGLQGKKAAERAQQARLAGAVRARHDQRRALVRLEREPFEQPSPAALDRQVPRAKAH